MALAYARPTIYLFLPPSPIPRHPPDYHHKRTPPDNPIGYPARTPARVVLFVMPVTIWGGCRCSLTYTKPPHPTLDLSRHINPLVLLQASGKKEPCRSSQAGLSLGDIGVCFRLFFFNDLQLFGIDLYGVFFIP